MANLNLHGAWIYLVWNGPWTKTRIDGADFWGPLVEHKTFATVDAASKYMHEKLVASGEIREDDFEKFAPDLTNFAAGTLDCFHSIYPIVWFDPALDCGQFDVDDYEEWEASQ